uniref:glycosyltransferase family 2 protein n=1 Tax=Ningiella ruwaisensis TaxID=2364274 RepID=UPI001F4FBC1E|nr:glycosyltransferase family 2 protein [Ningiella ruwaisensis]
MYNPDITQVIRLINSLSQQVDKIVVIDNSLIASAKSKIGPVTEYLHHPENIGIAAAHNIGLKRLKSEKFEYALLLDQDSNISNDMVFKLSSLHVASQRAGQSVIAIGPRVICSFSDKPVKPLIQREIYEFDELIYVTQIISSGMLIWLEHIEKVGYKDESLFIDGVDHEWCWRAKSVSLNVAIAKKVEMLHRLGDARRKFVGVTMKVGSPIRLYYQFRNILLLSRRPYVPLYWKVRNLALMPLRMLANSCLHENSLQRIKFMFRGIIDGIRGKSGRYKK